MEIRTKHELFAALSAAGNPVVQVSGIMGHIQAVEREDGGGSKFNVRLHGTDGFIHTVFLKTLD